MNTWSPKDARRIIDSTHPLDWIRNTSKPTTRLSAKNYYETMRMILEQIQRRCTLQEQTEACALLMQRIPTSLANPGDAKYAFKSLMHFNDFLYPGLYVPLLDALQATCPPSFFGSNLFGGRSFDYYAISSTARYAQQVVSYNSKDWDAGNAPLIFRLLATEINQKSLVINRSLHDTFIRLSPQDQLDTLTFYTDYGSSEHQKKAAHVYMKMVLNHMLYHTDQLLSMESPILENHAVDKYVLGMLQHYTAIKPLLTEFDQSMWRSAYMGIIQKINPKYQHSTVVTLSGTGYSAIKSEVREEIWNTLPDELKQKMVIASLCYMLDKQDTNKSDTWIRILRKAPLFNAEQRLHIISHTKFRQSKLYYDFDKFIAVFDPAYASIMFDPERDYIDNFREYENHLRQQVISTLPLEIPDGTVFPE